MTSALVRRGRISAVIATMAAAGCGLAGCGSGGAHRSAAAGSSVRQQEQMLCRRALSRAAGAGAKLAQAAQVQRSALESYLSLYQRELSTVVHGLGRFRSEASDTRTLDLAIRLDQETLHREAISLRQLRGERTGRVSQAKVHEIFGPVSQSENAAAVRLATTDFPTVCLGEA